MLDSREDRKYRLFSVNITKNRSPRTGEVHEFQVLNTPDWVGVIPVTTDNKLVLVRQFRHGSGELSLEPPGGLAKEGRSPEQSAREELEEETGYVAETFELLGCLQPLPALFNNRFYVYLARDAKPTGKLNPDETEEIETVLIPVRDIREYNPVGKNHLRGDDSGPAFVSGSGGRDNLNMSDTSSKWLLRIGEVLLVIFGAVLIFGLWDRIISLQKLALQVLGIASVALGGSLILTHRMIGRYFSEGNPIVELSAQKPTGRNAGAVSVRRFCLRWGFTFCWVARHFLR